MKEFKNITRVEVIDNDGRRYVKYGAKEVKYDIQDDGKTLKIFVDWHVEGAEGGLVHEKFI